MSAAKNLKSSCWDRARVIVGYLLNKRILQYNYKMCSKTEFYVFRKLGILLIAVGQLTTNWFELPNNLALPK